MLNTKRKCIFIIGTESSGSTLIAKIISKALNGDTDWNGRGFNCCNHSCDKDTNYVLPCGNIDHLVCHRSLPFLLKPTWPPIEEWQSKFEAYFVICTRDTTISRLSVVDRFKREPKMIHKHHDYAIQIIQNVLSGESKHFIWSYETFMFLKDDYLIELRHFLGITQNLIAEPLRDANQKYITPPKKPSKTYRLRDGVTRLVKRFF